MQKKLFAVGTRGHGWTDRTDRTDQMDQRKATYPRLPRCESSSGAIRRSADTVFLVLRLPDSLALFCEGYLHTLSAWRIAVRNVAYW